MIFVFSKNIGKRNLKKWDFQILYLRKMEKIVCNIFELLLSGNRSGKSTEDMYG